MGCLFKCCFRATTKDDESTSANDSVSQVQSKQRGHHELSKNRLSALFLSEASSSSSSSSPFHNREGSSLVSMHIHKDEAQVLKACSITPVTPVEIKAPKKLETPQLGEHFGSTPSWVSINYDAMFHLDEIKNEPFERSLDTSEKTPSSCLTDARSNARISSASSDASEKSIGTAFRDEVDITSNVPLKAGKVKSKTKSARSECEFDQSYSSSSSKNSTSRKPEMAAKTNIPATSPNPTALKLSDEIQTPRTIFPDNIGSAVRGRQRFQDKTENESPTSTICEGKLEESTDEKYPIVETSWVKQGSDKNMEALSITHGDRPIIGMVAAHWNEKEQSLISPKWWDGNGIPNSTNKYKEDQKVSWHATSFEERLEKALSEEGGRGFIPRKLGIVEETERDTAIIHLRNSAQSMSVVSF
ncbi:PREDICTED: protein JASON-like isoform X2 [Camelina sativa]|uniref:Protein JASON-like isoform X2 n=1 Tax=Camelina sativa TaxID=90675 RepID=A0ABM0WE63_CAMSA|nr:PREDICTED: protein JASON-like isoform X2 [Camelina sativa]